MTDTRPHRPLPAGAVVVGYDESPVSGRALDWAADEAAREGRPLVVVHATSSAVPIGTTWLNLVDPATEPTPHDLERRGQGVLAAALARVRTRQPALGTIPVVALTDPASELAHLGEDAHLLVVGSRGHRTSRSVASGQLGAWLARRADCPVVVVPDFDDTRVRQGVLAGVAVGAPALDVLEYAGEYAARHDLPLSVVHAARVTAGPGDDERRRWLAEAIEELAQRFPEVRFDAVLLPGRPTATLLRMADRMDLLVVGQHHTAGPGRSPFDHVRSSIVDRSRCPVAVVPTRIAAAAAARSGR
jgi:nucleotide-binding universal stress UspA family protein